MNFSGATPNAAVVDGHAHLDAVSEVENSLKEAHEKGVVAVVGVGMDRSSNRTILELEKRYPRRVYAAVGLHPWKVSAEDLDQELDFVCLHLPEAVGLGEVGLDYKIKDTKALQIEALRLLLQEAARLDKPAITHSRFSHARTLQLLREANVRRAVFHWYSGPEDVLDKLLDCGFYISATPALAYSPPHQRAIKRAPLDRILLETDSPVVFDKRPSRPADVIHTLNLVADLKESDPISVARTTTQNAACFFGVDFLATPPPPSGS